MAARGQMAKDNVIKKLAEAFGEDFLGEYDKKVYVWANDGGERVQIAISMVCPKVPIEVATNVVSSNGGDWDFSDSPKVNTMAAIASAPPAEITEEEKANIAELMARLGL